MTDERERPRLPRDLVVVIGSSTPRPGEVEAATQAGRILAEEGVGLVSGGRGGVMAAAARGCTAAGGLAIGILPSDNVAEANPYNSLNLPTGVGYALNLTNVLAGAAVIVVGGGPGTLTELGYAIQYKKPLFSYAYLTGVSALGQDLLETIDWDGQVDLTATTDLTTAQSDLRGWLRRLFRPSGSD